MKYDSVIELIGDTPLVRIDPAVHGLVNIDLYAKLEMCNPFGSVKDRPAWNMISSDIDGIAERGETIVDLSSGNTARALAILASMHGVSFKAVTNRMKVPEKRELLLLLGAEIEELPGQAECLDPTNTDDPLTRIHHLLSQDDSGYFHTDQYYNERNTQAHVRDTGPEIIRDLDGTAPDYFVTCIGTAGSSTGTATALRDHDPSVEVVGFVAGKSDYIPGIRNIDEVSEVGLFDPANYDHIESIESSDAIDGMLTLIRRCGILGGVTAGAAYAGTLRHLAEVAPQLTERKTAVFLVFDRAEGYLSYLRQRRPELIGGVVNENSVHRLTDDDLHAVRSVSVPQAQQWIEQDEPLVVDLRGSFAYAALHIEGSVNIVDNLFGELLEGGVPFGKKKPVLLACPVGEKSVRYAALLTKMGHADVRSLDGGVVAWRDAGAPLVSD